MPSDMPPGHIAELIRTTSLHRALDALGDWWSVLLVREAFLGVRQFDEFQRRLAIPRQTLANCLRDLVAQGIFHMKPYQERPLRHEYRLTPMGLDLYPYALLLWRWQRRWSQHRTGLLPERLVHRVCGQEIEPVFACASCREPVTIHDVEWREPPAARETAQPLAPQQPARRSKRHSVTREAFDGQKLYEHGAFVIADRWAHLIITCAYLGVTTFDRFQRELGIAPNILTQRLRLLVDARLLAKRPDTADSRRYRYRLTDRSRDLYPISMMLIRWADRWIPRTSPPPMMRVHRGCGQPIEPMVVCSGCQRELLARQVRFHLDVDEVIAAAAA